MRAVIRRSGCVCAGIHSFCGCVLSYTAFVGKRWGMMFVFKEMVQYGMIGGEVVENIA